MMPLSLTPINQYERKEFNYSKLGYPSMANGCSGDILVCFLYICVYYDIRAYPLLNGNYFLFVLMFSSSFSAPLACPLYLEVEATGNRNHGL